MIEAIRNISKEKMGIVEMGMVAAAWAKPQRGTEAGGRITPAKRKEDGGSRR